MDNKEKIILEAAEAEFMLYGYNGSKTTAIAKRAGVTHAMLHYYFRTKENLFNQILNEKIHMLVQSVVDSFGTAKGLTLIERIEAGIGAHFDFIAANPELPRFVLNEVIINESRLNIMRSTIEKFYGTVLLVFQRELDHEVETGHMQQIKIIDLIINIVSMNLFPFVFYTVLENVILKEFDSKEAFLENRKRENIETIRRRLLINND